MVTLPADTPRTALVTGAGARLGSAIARALGEAGFDVAVHYRNSEIGAEDTAAWIRSRGRKAMTFRGDLSQRASAEALVEHATRHLGPLGVLVNNASVFEPDNWDTASFESWDRHLEPNLTAPFFLMQRFVSLLPEGNPGAIVNVLDQRVLSLTPHFISYTVSKAALWTLTQSLALAFAPRKVRVNGIGPGPVLPSARQTPDQFAAQCADTPLGYGSSPKEVAEGVLALIGLSSVTGQMLALDGGQHLQWCSPSGGSGSCVE